MPTVPDAAVELFLRARRANRTFLTVEGARRTLADRVRHPQPSTPPRRLRPDVRVSSRQHDGVTVYAVSPSQRVAHGTLVYAHGGGWVNEIALQHWQLAAQVAAEAGATVLLPIYRLVPFGTSRQAVDAVAGLVREAAARGPVGLAGDSAGGQIALSAALALRDAGAEPLPATVLVSPALDLTFENPRIPEVLPTDPWLGIYGGRELAALWAGDDDVRDPIVSPLLGDLAGSGPLTLFTGSRDVLSPDAHLLVGEAAAAGIPLDLHEVAGQLHVYPLLPTRTGAAARAQIVGTLRAAFSSR